jgi:riboflavin biosynthesis pyrimidine reductase
MRQLLPEPAAEVDPLDVYGDWPHASGRPGVRLNMIESADGAAVVGGLSGGLGGPADHRVFMALRSLADVVLVAAGTVRAEGYGPARLPGPLMERRVAAGRPPLPRLAIVSHSLDLDWDSALFREPDRPPIVLTGSAAPADARERGAAVAEIVAAGEDGADLPRALATLGERGARAVLAEGGPGLNAQLAAAGLIDELCLTLSPRLAGGGEARRILAGHALPAPRPLTVRSLCEEDGFLFVRYGVG